MVMAGHGNVGIGLEKDKEYSDNFVEYGWGGSSSDGIRDGRDLPPMTRKRRRERLSRIGHMYMMYRYVKLLCIHHPCYPDTTEAHLARALSAIQVRGSVYCIHTNTSVTP